MGNFTKDSAEVQFELHMLVGAYEKFMELAFNDLKDKLKSVRISKLYRWKLNRQITKMQKAHEQHIDSVNLAMDELDKLAGDIEPEVYIEKYMEIKLLVQPHFVHNKVWYEQLAIQLSKLLFAVKREAA